MSTLRPARFLKFLTVLVAAMLLASCDEPVQSGDSSEANQEAPADSLEQRDAAAIVQRARAVHGADVLDSALVAFSFRGVPFTVRREGGAYTYTRTFPDSAGLVRDELSNGGFRRTVDGQPVRLSEPAALSAEGALNSVVYFALLPYPLADPAVQPRRLGTDSVRGEAYNLVEITFRPEGGGRDYQDRFLYWIHHDQATVDYLAYSYDVNGGGARFREAYNPRTVQGVRFSDYRNYSAEPLEPSLEALGRLFELDSLSLLSEIVLDSVRVDPL